MRILDLHLFSSAVGVRGRARVRGSVRAKVRARAWLGFDAWAEHM